MARIRTLDGSKPHPSYRGWRRFLATCEKRDEADGVVFYGKTNCNYILFPNGLLVQNFGFWGRAMMNDVRERGSVKVLTGVMLRYRRLKIVTLSPTEGRLRYNQE